MTLTESPILYALGWTLFHFLWEGALIALALASVLYLIGPASARLRYGLACGAMLAMLVSFGLTLALAWPQNGGTVVLGGARPPRGDLTRPPTALFGPESIAQRAGAPLQLIV